MRITNACEKRNYPLPEWREVGPYTDIIFKPLEMESIHNLSPRGQEGDKKGASQVEVSELVKILHFCQIPRSISEMMELLGRGSRDKFLTAILKSALEKELLEMTIPDKPTSRLQKYVITKAGKKLLECQLRAERHYR